MTPDLSMLMITKGEPFAIPFIEHYARAAEATWSELVIAADGESAYERLRARYGQSVIRVDSRGYLESVLDAALLACRRRYVLRLDDDERVSSAMGQWLVDGRYREKPHWKFARAHLWGREAEHVVMASQLWPDHQTRLSLRELSGGRTSVHAGSPHGGGEAAPVALLHYKFLVKTIEERRTIAVRYESIQQGAGFGAFMPYNCPEDVWRGQAIPLVCLGSGSVNEINQAAWIGHRVSTVEGALARIDVDAEVEGVAV